MNAVWVMGYVLEINEFLMFNEFLLIKSNEMCS